MTNLRQTIRSGRWLMAGVVMVVSLASLNRSAEAYEWAVGKNQERIEAELVDFDGHRILLRAANNRTMQVDVADLNVDDLKYLNHRIQLRQLEIARHQLQQQELHNLSRYFDVWAERARMTNGRFRSRRTHVHGTRAARTGISVTVAFRRHADQ